MQLVATLNGVFFRAQSITESEIEAVKEAMLQDQDGLVFQVMTDAEFDAWLASQ